MTSTRLLLARHLMAKMAKRNRKGFTLIELLVVVVIIGILASVALPSFVGAQDKARNASVQSNARTVQMALEEFSTEHNGAYPLTPASWNVAGNDQFCGNGTTYLPGGKLPLSPWAKSTDDQKNGIAADGTILLKAIATVAATNPQPITTENKEIAASGIIPPGTTGPTLATHYGAVEYDYEPNTQYYVLYATGKKGKSAIVVSSVSNAGQ